MEDVRIGRKTNAGERVIAVTTSAVMIVSPSDKRVALVIGTPNAADVTLSMNSGVTDGVGMRLQFGQSPLMLHISHDGALVTKGFYAIAAAGTEQICVWETFLEDE